jgi:hypothetical protein
MEKNFSNCPHCVSLGKVKLIRPAVHGPLVSRSDGRTFHLYLEESGLHRQSSHGCPSDVQSEPQIYALFRYDLDPCSVKSESTLVIIPNAGDDETRTLKRLEQAADLLAEFLERAKAPGRLYKLTSGRLSPQTSSFGSGMSCAPAIAKSA